MSNWKQIEKAASVRSIEEEDFMADAVWPLVDYVRDYYFLDSGENSGYHEVSEMQEVGADIAIVTIGVQPHNTAEYCEEYKIRKSTIEVEKSDDNETDSWVWLAMANDYGAVEKYVHENIDDSVSHDLTVYNGVIYTFDDDGYFRFSTYKCLRDYDGDLVWNVKLKNQSAQAQESSDMNGKFCVVPNLGELDIEALLLAAQMFEAPKKLQRTIRMLGKTTTGR